MNIGTRFASAGISADRVQQDVSRRRFSQGSYAAAWAAANQAHAPEIRQNLRETSETEKSQKHALKIRQNLRETSETEKSQEHALKIQQNLQEMSGIEKSQKHASKSRQNLLETSQAEKTDTENTGAQRSEAEQIYRAAAAGQTSIEHVRTGSKVPYGALAKDGMIKYNGVTFVCDERTNSICLGDMTDEKNVLNIPLSGGGHLKVNRDSIGALSKAIGMFTPEDVNRILRAIHQDAKVRSMEQELEDMENSVGTEAEKGGEENTEQE